jgi:hypothetical protein
MPKEPKRTGNPMTIKKLKNKIAKLEREVANAPYDKLRNQGRFIRHPATHADTEAKLKKELADAKKRLGEEEKAAKEKQGGTRRRHRTRSTRRR